MVRLFLTVASKFSVPKAVRQLRELHVLAEEPREDGKIFFDASVETLRRQVSRLSFAERVFLCLREERITCEHPICRDGPNYAMLQEYVKTSPWDKSLDAMDELHGGRGPRSWMVDSKRHGAVGSKVRAFDKFVLQQCVRDALHACLEPFGCIHDPRQPEMMVFVFFSTSSFILAIPVMQRRVKQGYFPHKGLHHCLCWALAQTARPNTGEVVLDPMAGRGVVLLEAAAFWPYSIYLGSDHDPEQLAHSHENLDHAVERGVLPSESVAFLKADCRCLPLVECSVDVVLCDLPFGRQYGAESENAELYAGALAEVARVLRPCVGRAVLMTAATATNIASLDTALVLAGLQVVRRAKFWFGGNRDRMRCAVYCLVRVVEPAAVVGRFSNDPTTVDAEDRFDWCCFQGGLELGMGASGGKEAWSFDDEFAWRRAKPLLQLYVPWKAVGGRARETVQCDGSTWQKKEKVHGTRSSISIAGREDGAKAKNAAEGASSALGVGNGLLVAALSSTEELSTALRLRVHVSLGHHTGEYR